jgi:hypothetical protein
MAALKTAESGINIELSAPWPHEGATFQLTCDFKGARPK